MSEEKGARMATPPYVSYRTFTTFLEDMGQGIPSRLDKSAFPTMSGGIYNQLMPALRYLNLVDSGDKPTDLLLELIGKSDEEERRQILLQILTDAYPYILEDPEFDLMSITPKQLSDRFRSNGAAGDTVRKCETFFLAAARDAGVKFGRLLQRSSRTIERKPGQAGRTSRARRGRGPAKRDGGRASEEDASEPTVLVLKELMDKLPNFDPSWPEETQANYLAFAEKVMKYARQTGTAGSPEEDQVEESEQQNE